MFISNSSLPAQALAIADTCPIEEFLFNDAYGRHKIIQSRNPLTCGVTGKTYSFSDLRQRVDLLARGLGQNLGWQPNKGTQWQKVICVYSTNSIDTLPLAWAIHRLSGILASASATNSVTELTLQLQSCKAAAIFTSWQLLPSATEACRKAGISESNIFIIENAIGSNAIIDGRHKTVDDLCRTGQNVAKLEIQSWKPGQGAKEVAFLCFSSGTSGLPKAVMITHKSVIANMLQLNCDTKVLADVEREVCLCLLPQSHIYGLVTNCQGPIYRGAEVVILPGFDVRNTLAAIQRFSITTLFLVPTIIIAMLQNTDKIAEYDLSSVAEVLTGAAPMGEEILQKVRNLFPRWKLLQGYGLTEAGPTVAITPSSDIWLGSSGLLLPQVQCRLVSPDGVEIESYDQAGELLVKSPSLVPGYLNNDIANRETFQRDWLHTGDVALFKKSAQGNEHLFIVDRLKELIKVKGLQVAPTELEEHILMLDEVAECAVYAVEDEISGERPKAAVVRSKMGAELSDECVADRIVKHVQTHKSRHKWLKGGVEIVQALPKTSSGKVLRRMLRDQERQRRKRQGAGRL